VGDEGRQTLAGAVLRVLAPLDGSGRARGASRALAELAVCRGTPTLRGLVTCRSRPLGAALQSLPFPRSRTRSRGPLLPCEFAPDHRQRGETSPSRSLSPSRQLFARDPPGGEPRRMSRDDGFPRSLGWSRCHTLVWPGPARPIHAGLAGKQPARPLRSLAPPGSPFACDPMPWPGRRPQRRCSPGHFPSRACSIHDSGFGVSRRTAVARVRTPTASASENPAISPR